MQTNICHKNSALFIYHRFLQPFKYINIIQRWALFGFFQFLLVDFVEEAVVDVAFLSVGLFSFLPGQESKPSLSDVDSGVADGLYDRRLCILPHAWATSKLRNFIVEAVTLSGRCFGLVPSAAQLSPLVMFIGFDTLCQE